MKKIGYYISDYGFGHATRSIAIIRNLLKRNKDIHVTISTSFSLEFVRQSLDPQFKGRISYRKVQNDIGYVLKANSIEPDVHALNEMYWRYLETFPDWVANESKYLSGENVNLIISDISPLPFIAAKQLNIPSLGISNFTWYTAYQGMIDNERLKPLYEAYSHMDYFISLAGSDEPKWGIKGNDHVEMFCREVDHDEVRRLLNKLNPNRNRFIVFFGLGMKIGLDKLRQLNLWSSQDCLFVVSSNININKRNVIKIPEDYTESENYVAVSDLVVTKPGWSTLTQV